MFHLGSLYKKNVQYLNLNVRYYYAMENTSLQRERQTFMDKLKGERV